MNGKTARAARKAANDAATQVGSEAATAINMALDYTHGVERRVAGLEGSHVVLLEYVEKTEKLAQSLANWRALPFLGRLRWLVLGW